MVKANLKDLLKERISKGIILFLINRDFGGIRNFARYIGVSEKMIHLYIDQYYLPEIKPKFLRKKEGGYPRFVREINRSIDLFVKDIERTAKEKGLDEEIFLEAFIEIIEKN